MTVNDVPPDNLLQSPHASVAHRRAGLLTCEAVQRGPSDVTRSHSRAGCGEGALWGERTHDSLQQEGLSCAWSSRFNQQPNVTSPSTFQMAFVHACTSREENVPAAQHGAEHGGLLFVQLSDRQSQNGFLGWVGLHLK